MADGVSSRATYTDLILAFGGVPFLLVIVGALPEQIRNAWILEIADPTIATLYLTNFVHLSIQHLSSNILGYLTVMLGLFPLAVLADQKRELIWSSLVFLTIGPFIISFVSIETLRGTPKRVVLGFSGINAAYAGLLPLFIGRYLKQKVCGQIYPSAFAAGSLGVELSIVLPVAGVHNKLTYLLALLGVVGLGPGLYSMWQSPVSRNPHRLSLAGYTTVIFVAVPVALFVTIQPNTPLYGHLAGLLTGFSTSAILQFRAVVWTDSSYGTLRSG